MKATVTTVEACTLLKRDPKSFRREMRKLGVEPVREMRIGRSTVTVWDLQQLRNATPLELDDE